MKADSELLRRLATIAPGLETVQVKAGETIRAASPAGHPADAALQSLKRASTSAGFEGRVHVLDTLGEGAMGIVHLATQASLGRPVAVKALKKDLGDPEAARALLQEAWVTGSLEHPNIVPLYDLGLDADGRPVIVMKRIVGECWADLVHEPETVGRRYAAADQLEWNLRVFMQVCNAVHFAHAHGVLHLDLKPANVMIGGFGEVYLVDWGLAVSMAPDPRGRFPLATEVTTIRGTPSYIAPEMVTGEGDRLSERTDVYLLGAILFELVAGAPPHRGPSTLAVLYQAATERPELPDGAPGELADVCRRAMAMDPDERPDSAEDLRRAVEDFLRHRESIRLAEEATAQGAALMKLVSEAADPSDPEVMQEVRSRFAATRFGFRQALVSWEGNTLARQGLEQVVRGAVEFELARGEARSAALFAGELDDVPDDLRARLDVALEERADERDRAERFDELSRQQDPNIGIRTRTFVTVLLGLTWILVPLAATLRPDSPWIHSYPGWIATSFGLLLIAAGLGAWGRESLSKTRINREIGRILVFMLFLQALMIVAAAVLEVDLAKMPVFLLILWTSALGSIVFTQESRLAPSLGVFLVGLLLAIWLPAWRITILSAVNVGFLVNVLLIWGPAGRPSR